MSDYTAILIRAHPNEIMDIKNYVMVKYPDAHVMVSTGISYEDVSCNTSPIPHPRTWIPITDDKYHQEPDYD